MVKIAFCQATYSRDFEETKKCIDRVTNYVDIVIISYDQSLTESQAKWLEDKVNTVRYEWQDNMPKMRNSYLDRAKELGVDWVCVSDPDELYSEELCKNLRELIEKYDMQGYTMIGVPCRDEFINIGWLDEVDLAKEQPGGKDTDFWKPILIFKISGNRSDIKYEGVGIEKNVHETLVTKGRIKSINLDKKYYYTHRKNALKIWRNASRNMFIGGGGDNVGDENTLWVRLRDICNEMEIEGWHSFEKFAEKGMDWWLREKEKNIKLDRVFDSVEEKKKEIEERLEYSIKQRLNEMQMVSHSPGSPEYEYIKKKELDRLDKEIEDIIKNERVEKVRDLVQQMEGWMIEALQSGSNPWQTETRETAKWYYAIHPEEVDDFILGLINWIPSTTEGSDTDIEAFVRKTYFEALGRHPDAKGLSLYVGKIKDGLTKREDLYEILKGSQERRDSFRDIDKAKKEEIGKLDISDIKIDITNKEMVEKYVIDCYKNILDRKAVEDSGKRNYTEQIMSGKIRPEELISIFRDSDEYKMKSEEFEGLGTASPKMDSGDRPSPFMRRSKQTMGIGMDRGLFGQRDIVNLEDIDSSRYNTVGLCIMTPSNDIKFAIESITVIGKEVDEIHIQSDSFKDGQIKELKEIGKNIGKDVEIHIVEWKDDFGDYKNKACGHARTEWILILDHDEVPSVEMAKKLKEIILKSDRGNNFDQISFDVIDEIWGDGENTGKLMYQNRNKAGKPLMHWNIPNPYFGDLHIWLKQGYYPWKTIHAPYSYRHIKTKDEVLERSARNVILGGGGDTVEDRNPLWRELTNLRNDLKIGSWKDTNEYLKKGNIDIRMIEIFEKLSKLKWKDEELRDLKKYYLKLHPMEEGRFV